MRIVLRDRILDEARDLVVGEGWNAVNMSQVARRVGVSRPALYNEIGTKHELATALIERETDRFLAGNAAALAAHPDDIVEGLAAAAEFTLRTGQTNELLRTILAGEPEELLSLVTADSEPVLGRAIDAVGRLLRAQYGSRLDDTLTATLDEVFVRLTVSHLMQPRGEVTVAVAQVRAVVAALVR
ncbi:TetR/AcrR family transcriptional regulator [Gordonia sp. TBRC 11910]|uniref:TetR/AcrR family transcriptional regulator n=2 Tax=Gordonia asplenii TaxID=2725283 RepID=A0A848KWJ1_9ACTN|nr:TetR/AcrR family transcriptional regulator [Gordonia asplenii]